MPMSISTQPRHITCWVLILIYSRRFLPFRELAAGQPTLLSSWTITASFVPAPTTLALLILNIGFPWKRDRSGGNLFELAFGLEKLSRFLGSEGVPLPHFAAFDSSRFFVLQNDLSPPIRVT